MITPEKMQKQADAITNVYSLLEDKIFNLIIKTLLKRDISKVDKKNVMLWQIEQLNLMGVLNDKVIKLLALYTKSSQNQIKKLIVDNGIQIVNEIDKELERMLKKKCTCHERNK